MIKLITQSIKQTILWTIVAGILYPIAITIVAQLAFHNQANGSLLYRNGTMVGSELIAQQFQTPRYFWPRPSAGSYATVPSGASNYGPTSQKLQAAVKSNADALRKANNLPADAPVPADLVFTSASGLDPHISPEAAQFQIARVASARGISQDKVKTLVEKFIEPRQWGFLGEPRVNVLKMNLALDELDAKQKD
jgi:K+-transporting ATPase ATPase C chain